jgi:hypothetical protein
VTERAAYFWDSCVFYKFLNKAANAPYTADVVQFIEDAKRGEIDILCSTLIMAEIRPSALIRGGYPSILRFLDDMKGAFRLIGPTPDIMQKTAILKDHKYKHKAKEPRDISTPDAIHLLTCLHAKEDLGFDEIIFHTFDNGGGKNWEGKCVPLLTFQEWTDGTSNIPLIGKIAAMKREIPIHSTPHLPGVIHFHPNRGP